MPRSAYPPPQQPDGGAALPSLSKHIEFLHPGYGRDEQQPLLILPTCDPNDTIDHELVRLACALVACNEFEGFFTTDVLGQCRVSESQLPFREEGYFFQVSRRNGMI